jgi:release factor glutamine methyltransferase
LGAAASEDMSWLTDEMRIGDIVRRLTRLFQSRGFWGASQDARALVGHVAGLDFTGLVVRSDDIVPAKQRADIADLVRRRLAFEPVGRILGSRDFMGYDLEVSAATLEPREDTEILVECALAFLDGAAIPRPIVADIGTGTGAILIAVLSAAPRSYGMAIDISPLALATAGRNALRHGVADRWGEVISSYASALGAGSCDLVLSNPPYIPTGDIAGLDPDVRDYDPLLALDGGEDGLRAYRSLAPDAFLVLKPGGALMVEIGSTQAAAVSALLANAGFARISVAVDRAGRDRVVIGYRLSM